MTFAKWVFRIAGLYGVLFVTPLYFVEPMFLGEGAAGPARVFYYGFVGVTLAWQVLYLVVSVAPGRYRPVMLLGAAAKLSFSAAIYWLALTDSVDPRLLGGATVDVVLAALFVAAFVLTSPRE